MTRKFLEDLGLEKEVVDKILDENSADIGKEIAKTTSAKTNLLACSPIRYCAKQESVPLMWPCALPFRGNGAIMARRAPGARSRRETYGGEHGHDETR